MNIKKIATGVALLASVSAFSSNSFAEVGDIVAADSMYFRGSVGIGFVKKIKDFNVQKAVGKDGDHDLLDNIANDDEDNDIKKISFNKESHFLFSGALGCAINQNFDAEIEYTYFMNKDYKNEGLKASKRFKLENNGNNARPDEMRLVTIDTEIKRSIHTLMIKGVMKADIGGCELRGIFGVGGAYINLEGKAEYKINSGNNNDQYVAEKNKSGNMKFDKYLEKGVKPAFLIGAGVAVPISEGVKVVADYGYTHIGESKGGIDNNIHSVKVGAQFAL